MANTLTDSSLHADDSSTFTTHSDSFQAHWLTESWQPCWHYFCTACQVSYFIKQTDMDSATFTNNLSDMLTLTMSFTIWLYFHTNYTLIIINHIVHINHINHACNTPPSFQTTITIQKQKTYTKYSLCWKVKVTLTTIYFKIFWCTDIYM